MRITMPIGHSIATPTKFMNRLKGARHDHLQAEKFCLRTADSRTAHGICVSWWCRRPGRCSTWRRTGCRGMGSTGVGGGAPAGAVGGGPSAGAVGGGSPGSSNPTGNGAAGTGNPSRNAGGSLGSGTNASPGITRATTAGGVIGGSAGVPSAPQLPGGTSPTALGSQPPSATGATAPNSVQGVAEEAPSSTIGLARPGPDGVSMVIVAPRPNRRNEDLHRYSGSKPKLEPYPRR
jgi:hypothetical protein